MLFYHKDKLDMSLCFVGEFEHNTAKRWENNVSFIYCQFIDTSTMLCFIVIWCTYGGLPYLKKKNNNNPHTLVRVKISIHTWCLITRRHLPFVVTGNKSVISRYKFPLSAKEPQYGWNRKKEGRTEGIICPKCFVLISSVGTPLNTVLSRQKKNGKAADFPCRRILHSPSVIFK